DSTAGVGTKFGPAHLVNDNPATGTVAAPNSPHLLAKGLAAPRIRHRIGPLRVDRAPAVLEVVDAAPAHVGILDPPKIDPHVRILVPEQRREVEVLLSEHRAPVLVVGARPLLPRIDADRLGWR